jgi:AcrR family transcriptional regulator|tara:strand:- start:1360 stop:2061 length:702 start_codon:yes stop_codon:yes gene_type:complete
MSNSTNLAWEPTPRWERRYREVLGVVATVFAEKGYAGSSTRDMADRIGIRQASLYYYFASKEAALASICEHGVKDFIDNLSKIIAEPTPITNKLRAAIANHLSPLRSQPEADYIRVFVNHRHELPNGPRQEIGKLAHTYQALVEDLFGQGIESGELQQNINPKLAALALLGLCNSVISNRALPQAIDIDVIIDEYTKLVAGGMLGEKSRDQLDTIRFNIVKSKKSKAGQNDLK